MEVPRKEGVEQEDMSTKEKSVKGARNLARRFGIVSQTRKERKGFKPPKKISNLTKIRKSEERNWRGGGSKHVSRRKRRKGD